MFNIEKQYKTKAMAINAIRMTATNKGWKVLTTEDTAKYVKEVDGLFVVDNAGLNVELGFTEATPLPQRVSEGVITEGKALEAVSAALAEAGPVAPVPAANTKPKRATKEELNHLFGKDKPANNTEAKQTRCTVVNGARRPLRGKTLEVWETTERLYNVGKTLPTCKQVFEALTLLTPGFNKTTCNIQYYACVAYNGWKDTK